MATFHDEEVTIRRKRFVLPTPWPQGAAIGELDKMLAVVRQELGDDYSGTAAWVLPEDDQVVIYIETTEAAR